jgi:hypothetical protein
MIEEFREFLHFLESSREAISSNFPPSSVLTRQNIVRSQNKLGRQHAVSIANIELFSEATEFLRDLPVRLLMQKTSALKSSASIFTDLSIFLKTKRVANEFPCSLR